MKVFVSVLLALSVASANPRHQDDIKKEVIIKEEEIIKKANNVVIESIKEMEQATVVASRDDVADVTGKVVKGDPRILDPYLNDDSMVIRTCRGFECMVTTVGKAKEMDLMDLRSVAPVKAATGVEKALTPALTTMSESMKKLAEQKMLLESLEASMAALTQASNKGASLAEAAKGQFAASITKGLSFDMGKGAMAPPSKGLSAAPPSKGFAAPPSKGASMAASMQLEAAMCPMTMYELGKTQKLKADAENQMQAANVLNAGLMVEKQRLEAALMAEKVLKEKALAQAAFNAKVAGEQKAKADMFMAAHAQSEAEKEMVKQQKAQTEAILAVTQQELLNEKATNAALTAALANCNEEKDALNESLAEQTARAEAAEAELADTKAALEAETDARIECEETLAFTQTRLAKSEDDLNKERVAREQTEEELMKTMTDLAACQRELRVTTEILSRTQDELQDKTQAFAREQAAREALEAKLTDTVEQLRETEQALRDTQRALEDEQNAHARTQRELDETKQELEATEAARQALEEAKQQLEDELAETKAQLEAMTAERDQLQVTLDATNQALQSCTADKMALEAALAQQKAIADELSKQLGEALMMLKAEKEAREELTETIVMVQAASLKVQEEVKKLQLENLALQQQVEKLRSEQETALALAAGCPPTYEKFGSGCYKYVREKSQWKMAQEQCMKDSGNLVAIESTEEQIFLTNYLKRHGVNDAYAYTSGNKQANGWKWLGAENNHMGATGAQFWYNLATQMKPMYNCQAMYLADSLSYGKWVGIPCYSSAPFVCEYSLLPPGTEAPPNPAEQMAILQMAQEAPAYLSTAVRYRQ